MCIAILKPEGKFIDEQTLQYCWEVNPDGAGYSYVDDHGNLVTNKFMSFGKFYKQFRVDQKNFQKTPFLIHFRAASVGLVNEKNCHPFVINEGQAFIHNGTIFDQKRKDNTHVKSDTFMFNENILQKMPFGWEKSEGVKYLLEDYIGSWNKVAILSADKTYLILNEDKGRWDRDIWWSNGHYTGQYTRQGFQPAKLKKDVMSAANRQQQDDNKAAFIRAYRKQMNHDQHFPTGNRRNEPIPMFPEEKYSANRDDECEWCNMDIVGNQEDVIFTGTGEHFTICGSCNKTLKHMGGIMNANA